MTSRNAKTAAEKQAERNREYSRNYYYRNRDKILEKQRLNKRRAKAVNDPLKFISIVMSSARSRAKKKGMTFNITKEDIAYKLLEANGSCQATGIPLSFEVNCDHLASIDRIDSTKGYVKGNIRIVTTMFNYAKNTYTDEQFDMLARGWIAKRAK